MTLAFMPPAEPPPTPPAIYAPAPREVSFGQVKGRVAAGTRIVSIRGFWDRHPVEEIVGAWRAAGIGDVRGRRLSLGGGLVLWGTRGA